MHEATIRAEMGAYRGEAAPIEVPSEAAASKLPPGTRVIINGRVGTVK